MIHRKKSGEYSCIHRMTLILLRTTIIVTTHSRFGRAKIYMQEKNYTKAHEDFKYIFTNYSVNKEAESGVSECERQLKMLSDSE